MPNTVLLIKDHVMSEHVRGVKHCTVLLIKDQRLF